LTAADAVLNSLVHIQAELQKDGLRLEL